MGVIGNSNDILTIRPKGAEESLRQERTYLQRLYNAAGDAIITTRLPERIIEQVNCNAMERIFGYKPEECIGRPVEMLYANREECSKIGETLKEALEQGVDIVRLEPCLKRKNGEVFQSDVVYSFFREDNNLVKAVGIVRDISERKRVEDRLRESEARWRSLVKNIPDIVLNIDHQGKILFINRVLMGFVIEKVTGDNVYNYVDDYIIPEHREMARHSIRRAFKTGEAIRKEIAVRFPYVNSIRWYSGTIGPVKNGREVESAVIIARDITRQKQREEELLKYRGELEKLVEERTAELKITHIKLLHAEKLTALGKLAASIAHEFGSPIFGIRMSLQQVIGDNNLKEDGRELLNLALKESERVNRMLQNLRDLYRPSNGITTYADIHQIIEEALQISNKKLVAGKIKVLRDFTGAKLEIPVIADQIMQVFLNLITNAGDAMASSGGGTLTVKTEVAENKIYIVFKDTGCGIGQEDLTKVFEPFFSTKSTENGTGLGLAVSQKIVRDHGGNISVESVPGQGCIFTVELPM